MKSKLHLLALVGLAAWSLSAVAQDNTSAGDSAAATNSVVPAAEPAQPPAAEPVPTPVANDAVETNSAPAASDVSQASDTDSAPAPVELAQATTADAEGTNSQATGPADGSGTNTNPGGVITLITMDDVPLTDAIKNLARQAGLNYILDPKVSFGQVGPDGRPVPQPSVSIRWENVTAQQALNALLGTYNLQLVEDPKSKIAKVTVRDPAAPPPLITKIIQLKFAAPSNIVSAIQTR